VNTCQLQRWRLRGVGRADRHHRSAIAPSSARAERRLLITGGAKDVLDEVVADCAVGRSGRGGCRDVTDPAHVDQAVSGANEAFGRSRRW